MTPWDVESSFALSRRSRRVDVGSLLSAISLLIVLWPGLAAAQLPPGVRSDMVQVRFAAGTDVTPPTNPLPPELATSVASIVPLFTLSESELDALTAADEELPDLTLWFEMTLVSGTDPIAFITALRALPAVDVAQFAALPAPLAAVTPDLTGNQGYLGPATDGIDATFSATVTGGNGAGITIYDVEYTWNQNHEDLTAASGVALLLDAGDTAADPFPASGNHHGTAVLGELVADNDAKGVTGISWGASVGLAPAFTVNLGYNPANAILLAVDDASPGDVILLEQQTPVCNLCGEADCTDGVDNDGDGQTDEGLFGPLEWMQSVFDAIQTAVANRIVVVEAAGNGGVNLDQPACGVTFNRAIRDSGAIIVGAGGPPGPTDRQRLGFSSFGSRVDLQGWGQGVQTTGYGATGNCLVAGSYVDPDDPDNQNRWYCQNFAGTSSASPIVAGAAANLQGIAIDRFGTPLIPFQLRSLLQSTGSPQLGPGGNIGPRPDLQNAIAAITAGAIDLFILVDLSASFSDDLPLFKAQAPGIINTIQAMNPNVQFGLGRFEDYPIWPFGDPAAGDRAYERLVDLTFNTGTVLTAINGLTTRSGADDPESQLVALFQAASGTGQDLSGIGFPDASIAAGQQANFRNGATKLFLLWTDDAFHLAGDEGSAVAYPGPTFAQTVAAILALDPPQVIGISSGPAGLPDLEAIATATSAFAPEGGVDCDGDGAPDIAEGEPIVCQIASSGVGIGDAIVSVVEAVVEAATPKSMCVDVSVPTDPGLCSADVSIDNGSFDPDGGPVTLEQSPPPPYPTGDSAVTLKVTDDAGLTDFCVATVTVTDQEAPIPSCNAPTTIVPLDAPITFTASATDNCGASTVVTGFDCFDFTKKGRRIDKTLSCVVSIDGDAITITDSGGVGNTISWTIVATDESGNTAEAECSVSIAKPGR